MRYFDLPRHDEDKRIMSNRKFVNENRRSRRIRGTKATAVGIPPTDQRRPVTKTLPVRVSNRASACFKLS